VHCRPDGAAGGCWPGAAVADGVALAVGHRAAPGRAGVAGGGLGEVPGQVGVDEAGARKIPGRPAISRLGTYGVTITTSAHAWLCVAIPAPTEFPEEIREAPIALYRPSSSCSQVSLRRNGVTVSTGWKSRPRTRSSWEMYWPSDASSSRSTEIAGPLLFVIRTIQ